MLVVVVAEKSQRNRFMLESFTRKRYERDKLQANSLSSILSHVDDGECHGTIRLPFVLLEKVANYARALDKVIKIRFELELKVAQWLAYHRLFACGAELSVDMMDWRLVGFHKTITIDHCFDFSLNVVTYLRIHWMKIFYDGEGEVQCHGIWRKVNRFDREINQHNNIGLLNITEVDDGVDYEGGVVCVYSKLPMVTHNRQYDVIIIGKSSRYCYDEWEELYWPFTRMVREELVADNSRGGSDDDSLFSDNS